MNLCVVSKYNGTKEDYLKLYESFKDDIAKHPNGIFINIYLMVRVI